MMNSRERRLSLWSNATCAVPICEALTSCRGQRAHHAQMDRVGTWDIPRLAVSCSRVQDCYHPNYNGAPTDGSTWTGGDCTARVIRGGSWGGGPEYVRPAFRDRSSTNDRNYTLGFRVGRTLVVP